MIENKITKEKEWEHRITIERENNRVENYNRQKIRDHRITRENKRVQNYNREKKREYRITSKNERAKNK